MSRFSIPVYSNDSNATFLQDIGPIAENVRISTCLPGGCRELRFRVPYPTFLMPYFAGPNFRVDVADEGGIFWSGRMEKFTTSTDAEGGEYWSFAVVGFAANGDDQMYLSQNVGATATNTIVENAITNLMPQIGATSITATGVTLGSVTVTLRMKKGNQVHGWVELFGNSSNSPMIRHVYPRSDRTIVLTFEPRPTTTSVYLSVRQMQNYQFGFDMSQFVTQVAVQYAGAAATLVSSSSGLQAAGPAGINLTRQKLTVNDEITTSGDARQLANAILQRFSQKRMTATSLVLNPDAKPLDENGSPIQLWRVRSGKLAQITDITAAQGSNDSLTFNNSCLIVGTDYDEDSGLLTITPESYETYLQYETARARQLLEGRLTVHT